MSSIVDLAGSKVGKLMVIEIAGRDKHGRLTWNCICDCGEEVIVRSNNLRTGNSKSCGCEKRVIGKRVRNLIGQKFSMLTPYERDMSVTGKVFWKCKCECGKEKIVSMGALTSGHTQSCGCLTDRRNSKSRRRTLWSQYIFKVNEYMCVRCGQKGGKLNAHHLDSYTHFPKRRFDVENGVCLCEKCHTDFHRKYGYIRNVAEQFFEYLGLPRYERDLIEFMDIEDAHKGKHPKFISKALEIANCDDGYIGEFMRNILAHDLEKALFNLNKLIELNKQ